MTAHPFAYIAESGPGTYWFAKFSGPTEIEIIDLTLPTDRMDASGIADLQRELAGRAIVAPSLERFSAAFVPAGIVGFDPVDLNAFVSLFGANVNRTLGLEQRSQFESDALLVAEQLEWLIQRGSDFIRSLEDWALSGRPELHSLFVAARTEVESIERTGTQGSPRKRKASSRSPKRTARAESSSSDSNVSLEDVFARGGGLSQVIPGYEERMGQLQMATEVETALEHDGTLLVEAGTGIGKSLAYLVPSALWSQKTGEPVVISTYTRGLQEQLIRKDMRLAAEAIAAAGSTEPISGVALKGRSNYLCLRRWMQVSSQPHLDPVMDGLMIKIAIWLETTSTGDRSELFLTQAEETAFNTLSASTENCLQSVCRATFGTRCFLNKSRADAQRANIVVVNHALLFARLGEDSSALSGAGKLIVDEAHHLESVATSQFSFAVSARSVSRLLAEYASLQGTSINGYCGRSVEALSSAGALSIKPANARKALELLRSAVKSVESAIHWSGLIFQAAARFVEDEDNTSAYAVHRRILSSTRDQPNWESLSEAWAALDLILGDLLQSSRWLAGELADATGQSEALEKLEPALLDLARWRRDLEEVREQLKSVIDQPEDGYVYWFSGRQNSPEAALYGAPLDVADLVSSELLAQQSTTVLTSATLRTQGTFRLVSEQLGIADADELVLESPFDYRNSTMLYIARDVPDPRHADYLHAVGDAICGLGMALEGRTLALFTSHAAIRGAYSRLGAELSEQGITVLAQDIDGPPNQLIERMKREPRTVVLGVAAFWEGVDVPGDELSGLVVTRLPFDVPTDPLFAARSEQFENPFQQYALPRAALKFRQGFGRLIRTANDRGVVAVLDNRIFTKSYGTTFIRALPDCTVRHGTVADLGETASDWISSGPIAG